MLTGIWGKKVGMTQIFSNDKVHPVTAVDIGHWIITNIRTQKLDGYNAIQVGLVKNRFKNNTFSSDWLKKVKKYFDFIREIKVESIDQFKIGNAVEFETHITEGDKVDVFGKTKGCGFTGVVKRHGFTGARASHGSTMGKHPGSIGGARKQGKIIKGKAMGGHMGVESCVVENLNVLNIDKDFRVIFVQGSMPGKAGSLVFLRKVQ